MFWDLGQKKQDRWIDQYCLLFSTLTAKVEGKKEIDVERPRQSGHFVGILYGHLHSRSFTPIIQTLFVLFFFVKDCRTQRQTFIFGLDGTHDTGLGAGEVFPPVKDPSHDADQTDDSEGGTAIVHVVGRDGARLGEVEVDAGKDQEHQPDGVDQGAPLAQGVGARDGLFVAGEVTPQADEKRHGVTDVEAEGGDGDDGAEAFVAGKVDAVESHLDRAAQEDAVDGDLGFPVDPGKDAGEGQAVVAREGPQGPGALGHEAVGADQDDDGDEAGERRGPAGAAGRVVEDLDQGYAGAGVGRGLEVADAEKGRDQKDETGKGAEEDGEDDGLRGLFGRVEHFFGHAEDGFDVLVTSCEQQGKVMMIRGGEGKGEG